MIAERGWAVCEPWGTPAVDVVVLLVRVLANEVQAMKLVEHLCGTQIVTIRKLYCMYIGFIDCSDSLWRKRNMTN